MDLDNEEVGLIWSQPSLKECVVVPSLVFLPPSNSLFY